MRDATDPRAKGHLCCQGTVGLGPHHTQHPSAHIGLQHPGFRGMVAFCLRALRVPEDLILLPNNQTPQLMLEKPIMKRKSTGDVRFSLKIKHFLLTEGLYLSDHHKTAGQVSKACLGLKLPIFIQGACLVPCWSEKPWQGIKVPLLSCPPDWPNVSLMSTGLSPPTLGRETHHIRSTVLTVNIYFSEPEPASFAITHGNTGSSLLKIFFTSSTFLLSTVCSSFSPKAAFLQRSLPTGKRHLCYALI